MAALPTHDPLIATARAADNLAVLNKAGKLWSKASLERAAALFEREWSALVRDSSVDGHGRVAMGSSGSAVRRITKDGVQAEDDNISALSERMIARMSKLDEASYEAFCETLPAEGDIGNHAAAWRSFVESAVEAFTSLDLLHATRMLLRYAKGSFGLVMSHSLECQEAVVIAARGQGMSIACYPQQGIVLWGSEASATKVAMGLPTDSKGTFAEERPLRPSTRGQLSSPGGRRAGDVPSDRSSERVSSTSPVSTPKRAAASKRGSRSPRSGKLKVGPSHLSSNFGLLQKNTSFRLDLDDVTALES